LKLAVQYNIAHKLHKLDLVLNGTEMRETPTS